MSCDDGLRTTRAVPTGDVETAVNAPAATAAAEVATFHTRYDPVVPRRLLVLACTRGKLSSAVPLPAIALYDGPTFRLLRRYLRTEPNGAAFLEVRILSAQHGLLTAHARVMPYDQRLTSERSAQLIPMTQRALTRMLTEQQFAAMYIEVGRAYAPLVPDQRMLRALSPSVTFGTGSMGHRLASLHDWLFGAQPLPATRVPSGTTTSTVTLRGVPLPFSREDVLAAGRQALTEGWGDPRAYHAWCVPIDGMRVAPKWLVALISGLAPATFHSGEARRVLSQLGVEVERV